jgi:phosphohistidine phosphatase SixA
MELYIVRHGIAADRGLSPGPDAERVLTPKGITRTTAVASGLRALGVRPQRVASSPLKRCAQTAAILADVLGVGPGHEVEEFLAPGACARSVVEWLHEEPAESSMIVGHMPDVAEIAAELISNDADVNVLFKKAAACSILFECSPGEGKGCLQWLLQPRQLVRIADLVNADSDGQD